MFSSSELSQKAQAERETKRQLHENGVAKKKEIIGKANQLKTERKVESNRNEVFISITTKFAFLFLLDSIRRITKVVVKF